ncbi:MAG: tetratricopeptide repeat protein [Planctomycetota bacterium]|nr:tetratricopeptide repeat protein [Planctomycetota bacterium]
MDCSRLLLGLALSASVSLPAIAQGPRPSDIARYTGASPGTIVIQQSPRRNLGIGTSSRANINLLSTRRFYTTLPVPPIVNPPRPCPPRPCPPHIQPHPYPISTGSGLSVGGSYSGDGLDVSFGVGSGGVGGVSGYPGSHCDPCGGSHAGYCPPIVIAPPFYYTNSLYYSHGRVWGAQPVNLLRGDGPIDPRLFTPQPATASQPPAQQQPVQFSSGTPSTLAEHGVRALLDGRPRESIAALRRHLDDAPDDARAMRVLAIALLADRNAADAVPVMRLAYRTDPLLAREPLIPQALGFRDNEFRQMLTRAVAHAHEVNSSSAWLTVTVLMQGEERDDVARTMLARAKKAGLEPAVHDALAPELAR